MGRNITQVTIVYDLAGLNTRHMRPGVLPFFADMMSLTQNYYTGPVKRMIIIRAPAIFRACWGVVKHVFPEEARAKMVFTGSHNHEEILSQYMDLSVLPPVISPEHGQGYAAVGMPQRFEGGIPPSYDYQETFSIAKPDKLKTMILPVTTEANSPNTPSTTIDDESSVDNDEDSNNNNNNNNRSMVRQKQTPDVHDVLKEAYGSSSTTNVTVSASRLGSGYFDFSEHGDVSTTFQSCV
jgi:hypothetical protein